MHRVPIAGREDGDSFLDHPGLATVLHTLPDYHNATPGPTQSIFPAWGDMGSSIGGISIRLENIEREIESR
jgi:hypothetical protein